MREQPLVDETLLDEAIAALARPVPERAPLVDRLGDFVRELTDSPRRAAACTVWIVALVVAIASTIRTSVTVRTALGAAHVRCGLDAFVDGARDPAVRSACRHVEAARMGLFVPAAVVVLVGLAYAVAVAIRRCRRTEGSRVGATVDRLRAHPWHTAAIGLGTLGLVVGAVALRPLVVDRPGSGGLVTAHCGVDTYVFGYPDRAIENGCGHAYGGRAAVLLGAASLVALAIGAWVHLVLAGRQLGRRRVALTVLGVAAAAVALVALRPVDVLVRGGPTPTVARCGIDTYLVGHPDRAVESACRRHVGKDVGVAAAAMALALVTLAASRLDPGSISVGERRQQATTGSGAGARKAQPT